MSFFNLSFLHHIFYHSSILSTVTVFPKWETILLHLKILVYILGIYLF